AVIEGVSIGISFLLMLLILLISEPCENVQLHKLGLFHCLRKLIPKNICIKLFCNETTITNDTQPHANYTHNTGHSSQGNIPEIPLLQIDSSQQEPLRLSPKATTTTTTSHGNLEIGQPKIVRFGTKYTLRRRV
ncbi:hypothetical protein K0M31_002638, partial [Melipona bicolor]